MPTLDADLDLQIEEALSNLGELDDFLNGVAASFSAALSEAFDSALAAAGQLSDITVTITADTEQVAPSVSEAVESADTTVQIDPDSTAIPPDITAAIDSVATTLPFDADTSAIPPELDAAASGVDLVLPFEADTSAIPGELDAAVSGVQLSLPFDADVTQAQSDLAALEAEVEGTQASIQIDADTSGAEQAIGDLSSEADAAGGPLSGLGAQVRGLGDDGVAAAAGLGTAGGEMASVSGNAAGAVLGVVGLGLGFSQLIEAGTDATSAQERFNQIVGQSADAVNSINVGSLNAQLGDLAIQLGTDDEALQNAASSLFQFARNSGQSREAAADFTDNIIALASRAVALNPALGSVADVAESMATRLARGGRFAAQYGLDLNAAEINTRAMGEAHVSSAADLSIFEKAAAGAQIGVEKYGASLKGDITEGAQNAVIQQRSLQEQINNVIEAAGKPLVAPFLDVLAASAPVMEQLGTIFSQLAQAALPGITAALQALVVPLQVFSDVIGAIPGPVLEVVAAFATFRAISSLTVASVNKLGGSIGKELAGNIGTVAGAAGLAAGSIGMIGTSTEGTITGILGMTAAGATLGSVIPGVGTAVGAAAGAVVGLGAALIDGGESVEEYRQHFVGLARDLQGLAPDQAVKKFIDALGDSDKFALFGQRTDTVGQNMRQLAATSGQAAPVVTKSVSAIKDELRTLGEQSPSAAQAVVDGFAKMRDEAGKPIFNEQQIASMQRIVDAASDSFVKFNKTKQESAAADQQLLESSQTVQEVQAGIAQTFQTAAGALEQYRSGHVTATAAVQGLAGANQELKASMDLLLGNFLSAQQATLSFQDSAQKLNLELFNSGNALTTSTQAGRDNEQAVLALGQAAQNAALSIFNQTQSVEQAIAPLQSFRQQLSDLQQAMLDAGNTEGANFLGGIITQVDNAIAQIQGRQPAATQAGADLGNATTGGFTGAIDLATPAGAAADGATGAVAGAAPGGANAGGAFGAATAGGWIEGLSPMEPGGLEAARNATGAVASQGGAGHAAGASVGNQTTDGLSSGLAGMPGVASDNVLNSVNAAALAGANAHNVGYGIGAKLSEGIGDGIIANDGYVQAQARQVIADAHAAARAAAGIKSPSRLFQQEVGVPIGQGIALGITITVDQIVEAAVQTVQAAQDAATAQISQWTQQQLDAIDAIRKEAQGLWATDTGKAEWVNQLWIPDDMKQAILDGLNTATSGASNADALATQALNLIKAGGDRDVIVKDIIGKAYDALVANDTNAADLLQSIAVNYRDAALFASSNTEGIAALKLIDQRLSAGQTLTPPAAAIPPGGGDVHIQELSITTQSVDAGNAEAIGQKLGKGLASAMPVARAQTRASVKVI